VIRQPDTPHPFALLFAQALLTGLIFLGLGAAGLGFVALAARYVQTRRGTRRL
jgi:MFS superfamily sulfate permease-like transporter